LWVSQFSTSSRHALDEADEAMAGVVGVLGAGAVGAHHFAAVAGGVVGVAGQLRRRAVDGAGHRLQAVAHVVGVHERLAGAHAAGQVPGGVVGVLDGKAIGVGFADEAVASVVGSANCGCPGFRSGCPGFRYEYRSASEHNSGPVDGRPHYVSQLRLRDRHGPELVVIGRAIPAR